MFTHLKPQSEFAKGIDSEDKDLLFTSMPDFNIVCVEQRTFSDNDKILIHVGNGLKDPPTYTLDTEIFGIVEAITSLPNGNLVLFYSNNLMFVDLQHMDQPPLIIENILPGEVSFIADRYTIKALSDQKILITNIDEKYAYTFDTTNKIASKTNFSPPSEFYDINYSGQQYGLKINNHALKIYSRYGALQASFPLNPKDEVLFIDPNKIFVTREVVDKEYDQGILKINTCPTLEKFLHQQTKSRSIFAKPLETKASAQTGKVYRLG